TGIGRPGTGRPARVDLRSWARAGARPGRLPTGRGALHRRRVAGRSTARQVAGGRAGGGSRCSRSPGRAGSGGPGQRGQRVAEAEPGGGAHRRWSAAPLP
ncbi:hypothetical protein, partial [Micromonospora sp. Rc5]|uniref:hypothetical protein n=1 Tax=Micromonospora sp. Rc5 TaxID=1920666 RepID=UPI001E4C3268